MFHRGDMLQLCQRPLNVDLKRPNHNNGDFIAPMMRDYLMPIQVGHATVATVAGCVRLPM